MKKIIFCLLSFITTTCYPSDSVQQWSIFEKSFSAKFTGNPFQDVQLSAQFKKGNQVFIVDGFYDEEQYAKKEAWLELYFLRTTLLLEDEVMIWNIYDTIREIESPFAH